MFDIPQEQIEPMEYPSSEYVQVVEKSHFIPKNKAKVKGIIKVPPKNSIPKTYDDLVRSKKDEENITELITQLAEKSKVNLLLNALYMEELGDKVRHVHPFKFFGYIFSRQDLKEGMQMILADYWKKNSFVSGMTPALNNEQRVGSLKKHLKHFCKEAQVEPYQIQPFLDSRDWEGMLHFLAKE